MAVAIVAGSPQPLQAAAFTVASPPYTDAPDAAPGDGTCADAAGVCTLRAAIQEANELAGPDTITLPEGTHTLTIPPATIDPDTAATVVHGDLEIFGEGDPLVTDLTITAAGGLRAMPTTIIDGGGLDRIFDIDDSAVVEIEFVTMTNGHTGFSGGGIINRGGSLTLTLSTVRDNVADDDGGGILSSGALTLDGTAVRGNSGDAGGGIFNSGGDLTIVGNVAGASIVTANTAATNGGGIDNVSGGTVSITNGIVRENTGGGATGGGGIATNGTLTITTSTVDNNVATGSADGGGINVIGGEVTITGSTLSGNEADDGGGIRIGAFGVVTITDSTIRDNTALDDGGGIFNSGAVTVENSTLSGNSAAAVGGALFAGSGTADLTHLTIANNNAGGSGSGGGIREALATAVTVTNTIVADNTGGDCSGTITVLGNNLDGDTSCGASLSGVNPILGSLQGNGGPTFTHALDPASPAINAAAASFCLPQDQRGVARPAAFCDIGAFERSLIDLIVIISVANQSAPPTALVSAGLVPAVQFQVEVTNNGPDDAAGVMVTITLSDQVEFESVSPGCEVADGEVRCEFGDLAAGASAQAVVTVRPLEAGTVTVTATATATAANEDIDPSNNTATASIDVDAPPEEEPPPEEQPPIGGGETLSLVAGGQFVFWAFGPALAADVFGAVKIAWLFDPAAVSWISFIPALGVTNFALSQGVVLWIVTNTGLEIEVPT